MKLFILLPAFNEEENIEKLVGEITGRLREFKRDFRIIVVDDGSRDRTAQLAEDLARNHPLTLIKHPRNRGLGKAIETGFTHVLSQGTGDDVLITMDCDNSHLPDYIPDMVREIQNGNEVVIASRFERGGKQIGLRLGRKLLSISARIVLRALFRMNGIRDYTCGYRAYKLSVLENGKKRYGSNFIESRGFSANMEILLKLRQLGARVKEVPLVLRYDLKMGMSKMAILKTIAAYLKVILDLKIGRLKKGVE